MVTSITRKRHWVALTKPPFLKFEEGGQLVESNGIDLPLITINALMQLANNGNLADDHQFDHLTVCEWFGIRKRLSQKEAAELIYSSSYPDEARELLNLAFRAHYGLIPDLVRRARSVLKDVADHNLEILLAEMENPAPFDAEGSPTKATRLKSEVPFLYGDRVCLTVGKDGRFSINSDPFLTMFVGINPSRIRRCFICGKIFWAGRIDKKCCSRKCNHTRIMRLKRSEEKRTKARQNRKYRRSLMKRKRGKHS